MSKQSKIKTYNSSSKHFEKDVAYIVDASQYMVFYSLILESIYYKRGDSCLERISKWQATRLRNGEQYVPECFEVHQDKHKGAVRDVAEFFVANILPNLEKGVQTAVVSKVMALIKENCMKSVVTELKKYKSSHDEANFLAEVFVRSLKNNKGNHMEINYHEIGGRIAARRKELRLTQEAVTNMTNISTNQLSNLENSHCVPTVESILKLSEALEVTPDYFLLGIVKEVNEASVCDISQKALLCTDKQKRLVSEFIGLLLKENY
jgi:transcriptional regulator with XRE-family HTH domain